MYGDPDERIRALDDLAWNWKGIVEKVLKDKFNRKLFFRRLQDKTVLYRLLSLRTWTLRYKLPLDEVLTVVLGFWDNVINKRRTRVLSEQRGLGCTIPCLCGDRSEELIEEYIKRKYPNGEHIRAWKMSKQAAYIRIRPIKMLYKGSFRLMIEDYTKKVVADRSRNQAIVERKSRARRRYPDNPWL